MDPTADDKAAEGDKASTTKSADISTNAGTSAATTNDEATDGGKAEGSLCSADCNCVQGEILKPLFYTDETQLWRFTGKGAGSGES